MKEVIDYMQENSGIQFDPKLIALFLENIDAVLELSSKYKG